MNYYKHHLGDYDSATSHLSWDEDMAYTRLLRLYYRLECALPNDIEKLARLIRATKKQKVFIKTVLDEFFLLQVDGWHNRRCDEEISAALTKAEKNRIVGKSGGRPRKEKTIMVSENNPDGFQENNPDETHMVSKNNPSHKPIANSHNIPTYLPTSRAREGAFPMSPDWEPSAPFWILAKRSGHTQEKPGYADALTDFIAYWLTNLGEQRTQSQWEKTFLESWKRFDAHVLENQDAKRRRPVTLSPHNDFEKRDYSVGINPDGSF